MAALAICIVQQGRIGASGMLWRRTFHYLFASAAALAMCGCTTAPKEKVVAVPPLSISMPEPTPVPLNAAGAQHVSAEELYRIYSQNLVIGALPDQRFYGRLLLVTGVAAGVNRRLAPLVYVELQTRDKDAFTYAEFAPGNSKYPETIQPGTTVQLLCRGGGMIAGSPLLRACRPV